MNWRRAAIPSLVAACVGLLAIRLFQGDPVPKSSHAKQERRVADAASGVGTDLQPTAVREALDTRTITIRTVDEQGGPLDSVSLVPLDPETASQRLCPTSSAICTTRSDGTATVDGGRCPIGSSWALGKAGFQTATLVIGSARNYDVVLMSGHAIGILVEDIDGRPVSGAAVFASSQVLPPGPELSALARQVASCLPCGTAPLHSCLTDGRGSARLGGLATGPIHVDVIKSGWVRSRLEPYPHVVPCAPIVAVMQPVYIAAGAVVGDTVASYRLEKPRGADGIVSSRLDDVALETRLLVHADICAGFIRSKRVDESSFVTQYARCRLLLKDTGYMSCDIPLQRADQAEAAFVIDASGRTPVPQGSLVLTVTNSDGSVLPSGRRIPLVVVPQDIPKVEMFGVDVDCGKEVPLPCGRYRLLATDDALEGLLPAQHDLLIASGANHAQVSLSGNLVPVRLEILDSQGLRWPYATYRVSYLDQHTVYAGILKNETNRTLWWRAGVADVSVSCDDRTTSVSRCNIELGSSGSGTQIRVTL